MIAAGAGKTTAFRVLTGDLSPTSGTAIIAGFDIVSDLRKVSLLPHVLWNTRCGCSGSVPKSSLYQRVGRLSM